MKLLILMLLATFVTPPALAEKVAIPNAIQSELSPLVKLNRDSLKSYMIEVKVETTMSRGPIVQKLFRRSTLHYDGEGRWHLVKLDPLQNEKWEIYSLGHEQSKLYLRKNEEPFRFAADPVELGRWLEAALQDFYALVEPMRQQILNEDPGVKTQQRKVASIECRCANWQEPQRKVELCLSDSEGAIVKGFLDETTTQSAGDYPLVTHVVADLNVLQTGSAVKAVEAPVEK